MKTHILTFCFLSLASLATFAGDKTSLLSTKNGTQEASELNHRYEWDKKNWGPQEKMEYEESLKLARKSLAAKKKMLVSHEFKHFSSGYPIEEFHNKLQDAYIKTHRDLFEYLDEKRHNSFAAWTGIMDACGESNKINHKSPPLIIDEYGEPWKKTCELWWDSRPPLSSIFRGKFNDRIYGALSPSVQPRRQEVFDRLMSSASLSIWDKADLIRLMSDDQHNAWHHIIEDMDDEIFTDVVSRMIDDRRILMWNYNTIALAIDVPDDPEQPEKPRKYTQKLIYVPMANDHLCDLAAKMISLRCHPISLAAGRPSDLMTLALKECGPTEKLTAWPGWKKMPAMQDEYVAKAKAWLEAYKQKRTAIHGLRAILGNPQIVGLDAKTWQSSWESLVLLEAQTPGYSDQRFNLLAEAFLREAMNPKATDRQMRQSCILGQLQQMWLDAKHSLDNPAADALIKPQAALDFLEAALAQLTPPLAKDPTAKTLWEYKVKDWRKEWNGKLEEFSKPPEKPSPNIPIKK